jgi:mannose-6-phosphate isomerase
MKLTQPIYFEPLFMERVWGGRSLETVFGKKLPHGARIGESWEIVDREEAQSVVHNGPLRGKMLHELWTDYRAQIFGKNAIASPRFPLLFKLLDAQERLSVQVHPPATVAGQLGGEPKTEMWYVAATSPGSDIFAGLKRGVSRADFEEALQRGSVEKKIHRLPTKPGDAIFIPSGRIHAIGAGNVIVEVQQNSDTTYRVFDWNRVGLDGKPREMHIEESMRSSDFDDIEPALAQPRGETVVECQYFGVEKWTLENPRTAFDGDGFAIFTVLTGEVKCGDAQFRAGDFFLVPAILADRILAPVNGSATLLRTTIP